MKKHIKRSISLFLVLAMVAGFLCEIPAFTTPAEAVSSDGKNNIYENMLADSNPSFETLNPVEGWNGVNASAVSFEEGKGVDKTYALYINDASKSSGYSVYSDDISVTPGEKYMASVQVSGAGEAQLYLRFYDSKGAQLQDGAVVAAKKVAKKDGWVTLEVTGALAPAKAASMRLWMATSQKGTAKVYFDNVIANVDNTASAPEGGDDDSGNGDTGNDTTDNTITLENRDFETGAITPWEVFANGNCSVTIEQNAGKGTYSAKITDDGSVKSYGRVLSAPVAVQPGQQLYLSVDTKMVSGTAYFHVYFKDANGASITIDPTRQTCPKDVGVWKTTAWVLTVPENAATMSLAVASTNSGSGTCYVDNATVLVITDDALINPDFEAGTLAPMTTYVTGNCSVDLAENAGNGAYSALITDDGAVKGLGRVTSNDMAVQPGQKLCLSVDTKMVAGTAYLHAYFKDANGAAITIDPARQTCPQDVGVWRTTAWVLTVPENAATVSLAVASANSGAGSCYVDNMAVIPVTDKEMMNPDFETGTMAPWSLYATGDCTAEAVKDAGKGTYSAKITDTGTEKNSARISSNEFVVQPKQQLLLSVDTKMEKGTFYLHAYFKDAEGKSITIDPIRQVCATDVGVWKTTTWMLTVPKNAATVSVAVASAGTGSGTGYVDNFAAIAISNKEVANGDFETGSLVPWSTMNTAEDGCVYSVVEDAGKGAYSVKMEDTGVKTARLLSNKIAVQYGQKVKLSVDTKVIKAGQLYLYVYFSDANGDSVAAEVSRALCPTDLKKWKTTTLEVAVPKGAVTMTMAVASSSSGKVTGYVDNLTAELSLDMNNPGFERTPGVPGWNGSTYGKQSSQYASDGQYSLCLDDPSESLVITYSSEKFPVTVGNKYCVSVDALSDSVTTQLYLRFYNKKNEIVSQKMVSVITTMDAWTPLELVDIEAPKGATQVGVTLATNAKSKGKAYFDNVYLYDSSEKYQPADTLVNPDFEIGTIEPWFVYATQDNTATISKDKATKTNKYSLLIQDNSEGVVQVTSKPINVKAGKTYGFYMESYMVGTGAVKVSFRYFNAKGEIIAQEAKACSSARDMWKKLVMHQVAPEGAVIAKITISTGSSTLNAKAYVDNMVFAKQGDKNFPDLADDQSSHNPPSRIDKGLQNGDFETGAVDPWKLTVDEGAVGEVTSEKAAGGSKYSLKIVDQGTQKVILNSQHLAVEAGKQYGFTMQTYLKGTTAIKMYVRFYDENGSQIAEFIKVGASEPDAWKKMVMLLVAPEGAKTVKITIATGSSSKGYDLYLDNVTFSKEGDKYFPSMLEDETGEISMPTPNTRPNWGTLQATSHPRLYFNADELETIKKFAQNSSFTSYGFSGKSAYESLINVADQYVEEDTLSVTARNTTIKLNARKLKDPMNVTEFQSPPPGFTGAFPYLENYAKVLYGRMQTLAMAYAMTGDVKYANRAIQYMSDMAEWTYWTDFIAIMGRKHWDEDPKYRSSMDTAYLTIAVATAYDMCYDVMTNAQREKIANAVITKALEPMYIDLEYTSLNNKLQHRASAMIFASIAIANNSNIPKLEKYLIRGYRMTEWYFDAMLTYGNQEGYSYTNNVIDFHMESVKALGRFTNDSSLLTHRLINEVVVDWVVYFMRPGDGYLPGISDANSKYYFVKTMCVLSSELENPLAGYYLTHTAAAEDLGAMARLIYCNKEPVSVENEEEVMLAANTLVEEFGYGSLRTGFDKDDTLLVMISNESEMYHNQYDQMSFVFGSNSQWLLDDPGYPTNMGDSQIPSAMYGLRYGHNTYVVDEQSQVNKGQGSMDLLLDTDLVGELHASAPGAYEKGLLTRAERNAIQINHKDASYYVMIDDFASNGEHVYGWNLNSGGWKKLTVDGTELDVGTTVIGHEIAIAGSENDTFVQFVSGEPVEVKPYLYNDEYGPMLRVNSDKAKEAQFMTVINTMDNTAINGGGAVIELVDTIDLFNCTAVWSNDVELETDVKEVGIDSKNCVFYRGQNNGDWIEFPFTVDQAGEYYVSANMGKHGVYGIYNIYLDGELVYEAYDGYSSTTYLYKVDLGHRKMEYGEHKIRLELVGKNPATTTATIGIHGVILEKERIVNMNENTLNVLETYDDSTMLGGKFSYMEGFTDVVLYNRGDAEITAGGITFLGKQATLLGIDEEKNYEGFSLVDGTFVVIGDKTMLTSDVNVSAALDLREGIVMSTFGEKEANVKLNVDGYCYTVMIDGEAVPSTKDGEMICFTVPAGNHDITFEFACEIDSYTYNNDATCRLNGTQTGICNICGNPTTITAPGTKTPHKYDQQVVEEIFKKSDATCTEAALYYLSCACGRCNRKDTFAVGEPLGHKWDGNTCSVCGEQKTEEGGILLWIIIGVAALAVVAGGITIFLIVKKKKKKEEVPAEAGVPAEEPVTQGEE